MESFRLPKYIETDYERALRKVAREVARLVISVNAEGYDPNETEESMDGYANLIEPWARAYVNVLAGKIRKSNRRVWLEAMGRMGAEQRKVIEGSQTGDIIRMWMDNQVALIRSIPLEAGQRVHEQAMRALYTGERHTAIQEALQSQEGVSLSKARLIARTETGRAQTMLVMAQSEQLGSEGYIWRTAKDGDVRPSHKEMEGKFVKWNEPPTLDGMRGHAGALPNCRCEASPVFDWEMQAVKNKRYKP